MTAPACPLCTDDGGALIWRNAFARVVLVDDADHPGFIRVILNTHVSEMTDLSAAERLRLLTLVFAAEAALRQIMSPDKVNVASLGNQVPHLHWHVIPRFRDDATFPDPIWAQKRRDVAAARLQQRRDLLPALREALRVQLDAVAGR